MGTRKFIGYNMNNITIMFTCSGGGLSPELRRRITINSRYDINIVAVDSKETPAAKLFCNYFSLVPSGKDQNYFKAIHALVRKYKIHLVIPCSDEEALVLAKNRRLLETSNCVLACADYEVLKIISNKIKTYDVLKSKNIYVPYYNEANSIKELKNLIKGYLATKSAVVVKPAVGRGGRDVSVISNNNDNGTINFNDFNNNIIKNYELLFPVIVMERLYEPIYDIDILAQKGKLIKSVVRRRINSNNPNDGHIIENIPHLHNLAEKLSNIFSLNWLYDCDIMINNKGDPVVLEINPRPSGSIAISVVAGINFIEAMISIVKNESISLHKVENNKVIIPFTSLI
jgi:carbamoyl-phosphate synthase large subunit